MIGIIGAMDEEVAKLKEKMNDTTIKTKAGMDFYCGMLNGKEVVVVRSGIGKVNAAVCSRDSGRHLSGKSHYQYRDCRFPQK